MRMRAPAAQPTAADTLLSLCLVLNEVHMSTIKQLHKRLHGRTRFAAAGLVVFVLLVAATSWQSVWQPSPAAVSAAAVPMDPGARAATQTDHQLRVYVHPLREELNKAVLTEQYDINRWFRAFGARPKQLFANPLNDVRHTHAGLEYRDSYHNGAGITFHSKLLSSPLLVDNEADADIVVIPYWVDLLCRMSQESELLWDEFNKDMRLFLDNFRQEFRFADSKPHVLFAGRMEGDLMAGCGQKTTSSSGFTVKNGTHYRTRQLCDFLCHPAADQINVMSIEVNTGSYEYSNFAPLRRNSWLPLPYPTRWHMNRRSPAYSSPFDPEAHERRRKWLAMEGLQVRWRIREHVFANCMERPELCMHYQLLGMAKDYNQTEIFEAMSDAWFCLQPTGDSPTRAQIFDCLAAETIPVFFDKYLTHTMPFADILPWDEISMTLDFNDIVEGNLNALDELNKQFNVEQALHMARKVHDWRHVFLYSDDPDWSTVRFDEMSVIHPNDDALTASLKSVMRHVCRTRQLPAERCYPPGSPADVDIRKRPSATTLSRDKRRSAATFAGTGRAVTE